MKIIIWDLEIFPFDFLGGFLIIHENGYKELIQLWSKDEIKEFYYENKFDSIFVGHNNFGYDGAVLESIIKGKNPYEVSKKIIKENIRPRCYLDFIQWDCMSIRRTPFSLKLTELISGKSIETSEVDFDIPRPLTLEEKLLTEKYNKSDLEQTLYNFERFYPQFELRLNMISTFDLPLKEGLKWTGTQVSEHILGVVQDESLKYKAVPPIIWPTLKVKNQEVLDWYLSEEYMKKNISIKICGADHKLGVGGIHAALNKVYYDKVLYYDVSGYYNLVMLNLDLLPRSLTLEQKELYRTLYKDQLEMKGIPEKANARKAYKQALLSVFGSMNNPYCAFYDPAHFYLVTLSGQLFIIDLLEKLEPYAKCVQSNTDGIVLLPLDWSYEQKIDEIVNEWEARTGFNMEKGYLRKLWQRDVNCYFALDDKENVDYKGDVINYITDDSAYGACKLFDANNPPVIAKGLIDCLLFDIPVEETVQKCKSDLRNFQYACKKGTFDSMTYDTFKLVRKPGKKSATEEQLSSVPTKALVRAFAAKIEYDEDGNAVVHTLTKHKSPTKKGASTQKVANLPESVFLWNESIENPPEELLSKIDWQYYIDKIYDKMLEFIP